MPRKGETGKRQHRGNRKSAAEILGTVTPPSRRSSNSGRNVQHTKAINPLVEAYLANPVLRDAPGLVEELKEREAEEEIEEMGDRKANLRPLEPAPASAPITEKDLERIKRQARLAELKRLMEEGEEEGSDEGEY